MNWRTLFEIYLYVQMKYDVKISGVNFGSTDRVDIYTIISSEIVIYIYRVVYDN